MVNRRYLPLIVSFIVLLSSCNWVSGTGEIQKQIDLPSRPAPVAGEPIVIAGDYAYLRVSTDEDSETLVIDPATLEIVACNASSGERRVYAVLAP